MESSSYQQSSLQYMSPQAQQQQQFLMAQQQQQYQLQLLQQTNLQAQHYSPQQHPSYGFMPPYMMAGYMAPPMYGPTPCATPCAASSCGSPSAAGQGAASTSQFQPIAPSPGPGEASDAGSSYLSSPVSHRQSSIGGRRDYEVSPFKAPLRKDPAKELMRNTIKRKLRQKIMRKGMLPPNPTFEERAQMFGSAVSPFGSPAPMALSYCYVQNPYDGTMQAVPVMTCQPQYGMYPGSPLATATPSPMMSPIGMNPMYRPRSYSTESSSAAPYKRQRSNTTSGTISPSCLHEDGGPAESPADALDSQQQQMQVMLQHQELQNHHCCQQEALAFAQEAANCFDAAISYIHADPLSFDSVFSDAKQGLASPQDQPFLLHEQPDRTPQSGHFESYFDPDFGI